MKIDIRRPARRLAAASTAILLAVSAAVLSNPSPAAAAGTWEQVSATSFHTCAIQTSGSLWCWGDVTNGSLGLGDNFKRVHPTQVGNRLDWASVTSGVNHTCALKTDGTRWCWGLNDYGQLGLSSHTDKLRPTMVTGEASWRSLSASGDIHTCGVRHDRRLFCWGGNSQGQLGVNDLVERTEPTQVGTQRNWAAVSTESDHTCALKTDGTRYCWGDNYDGQLGLGDNTDRDQPRRIIGEEPWVELVTGPTSTCGIRESDTALFCWGANYDGQLGNGGWADSNLPTQVSGSSGWNGLTVGLFHACANRGKKRYCWGGNKSGQLGLNDNADHNFISYRSDGPWTNLSAGGDFTCGIKATDLYCWGEGRYIGNGNAPDEWLPQLVEYLNES